MSIAVRRFDSTGTLRAAFHDEFKKQLFSERAEAYGILISGGSTPLPVFDRLAREAMTCNPNCRLIFTDDRLVPRHSPDSNYGNASAMISALGIDPNRIYGVSPDMDIESAAQDFHHRLREVVSDDFSIPIGFLGLGADGHTCSLFSRESAMREDVLAFAVPNRLGFDRVTVSRRLLKHVDRLILLVSGDSKMNALTTFLNDSATLPSGVAVADHPIVEVWTDLVI